MLDPALASSKCSTMWVDQGSPHGVCHVCVVKIGRSPSFHHLMFTPLKIYHEIYIYTYIYIYVSMKNIHDTSQYISMINIHHLSIKFPEISQI